MRGALSRARRLVPLFVAVLLFTRDTSAEDVAVPVGLQAELIAKIAGYDKNFPARAGDLAHVLIVTRPGDPDSIRTAAHMERALGDVKSIGGLSHDELTVAYTNAKALGDQCRARHVSIVYLTQALGPDVDAIREALTGVSVLSVAAVPEYVNKGVVLGFELVGGKPKLLVHLRQAKAQDVAFKSDVLKLVRVVE